MSFVTDGSWVLLSQVKALDLSRTSANTGFVDALILGATPGGPDGDGAAPSESSQLAIEELTLDDCFYLVESDVKRLLTAFPKLRVFRAARVRGVTDASLTPSTSATAGAGELTSVSLNGCSGVTSGAIAELIARHPKLRDVNVGNYGGTLSADFLPTSAPLKYLTNLDVSGAKLSEPDMKTVIARSAHSHSRIYCWVV
jgi:hypothetical protein